MASFYRKSEIPDRLQKFFCPVELGLEPTPNLYVERLVAIMREVRRVLRDDGTLWLNLGDSYTSGGRDYRDPGKSTMNGGGRVEGLLEKGTRPPTPAGLKPKDLVGIPWMVAFALRADGWYLRSDIVWAKPNPMPESVTDRPTKAHEYLFLLSKGPRYFFDQEAVREANEHPNRTGSNPRLAVDNTGLGAHGSAKRGGIDSNPAGRNIRSVWTIPTQPFTGWTPTVRRVPVALDEVDGDTMRIPSPDCPSHASWDRLRSTPADGVRVGDDLSHTAGNGARLSPAQPDDCAPTDPNRDEGSPAGSSDSLPPSRSPVASGRNTGTRKTALDPETTEPCTPSAESVSRTGGTSGSPANGEKSSRTLGNRNEPDDTGVHPSVEIGCRTSRTASCTCSYVKETTESISHFATFPPALVEPCIKAGTSERGCCAECGAPRERVVERSGDAVNEHEGRMQQVRANGARTGGTARVTLGVTDLIRRGTTGWCPTCDHEAESIPCAVLDPFAGSGTTGMVAARLGRSFVGIDLNAEYVAMAERRIREDAPLWNTVSVVSPPLVSREEAGEPVALPEVTP